MPSTSSNALRCAPRQERSARRLARFLESAAGLFEEAGFESTTMTAIAERSNASIGALYHYFPDKTAIAFALMNQYTREFEHCWKPLMEQAPALTHEAFADFFIERITEFLDARPAYLKLLSAPIRFHRAPAARKALRVAFANAVRAKNPSLSSERALLIANVVLQVVKGMKALYTDASASEKRLVAAEFKKILALYLATVLQ